MFLGKNYWRAKRNKFLLESISLPENGNLLDLSCGDGKLLNSIHTLKSNLSLFGIDISKVEIELATKTNPTINFQQSEATGLPFENNIFDVVICAMSLHHYEDLNLVLAEIKRVLKPDGKFFCTEVYNSGISIYPYNQYLINLYMVYFQFLNNI